MRLTVTKILILKFLQKQGTSYGLEIIKATDIFNGSFYPAIKTLKDNDYVSSIIEDINPHELGRPNRIYYTLTEKGIDYIKSKSKRIELLSN